MATITFIEAGGRTIQADIAPGISVMAAALEAGVDGIVADCGGNCSCGTCQVFVAAGWRDRIPAPSEIEQDIMELNPNAAAGQRLSCQILVSEALDGLIVHIPESQF